MGTKNQYGKNNHSWIEIDENKVIELYTKDFHSVKFIAKYFNVGRSVIRLRLKRNNIKIRSYSEQYKLDKDNGRGYNCGVNNGEKNGQYVHGKYVGMKKNRKQYLMIAKNNKKWVCEHCGKTSTSSGFDLVIHHIDGNNKNNNVNNLMVLCQGCHTKEHFKNESMKGRIKIKLDIQLIKHYYIEKKMSLNAVAKMFNVSNGTIKSRLLENNIKIRSYSEQYQLNFKPNEEKILKLYTKELQGIHQISKNLHYSTNTIRQILLKNSIQIRDSHTQLHLNTLRKKCTS